MKKIILILIGVIFMLGAFGCSNSSANSTPDENTTAETVEATTEVDVVTESGLKDLGEMPILVTSFGQSADVAMLKALFAKTEIEITYDPVAVSDVIGDYKTIVIAAGASTKGLGAAGIKPEEELNRAQAIVDYAVANDIKIIVAHLGGSSRRGDLSDQFIDIAVSEASGLIVVANGNEDGYFNSVSEEKSIPLAVVETISSVVTPLEEAFK